MSQDWKTERPGILFQLTKNIEKLFDQVSEPAPADVESYELPSENVQEQQGCLAIHYHPGLCAFGPMLCDESEIVGVAKALAQAPLAWAAAASAAGGTTLFWRARPSMNVERGFDTDKYSVSIMVRMSVAGFPCPAV